MNKRGQSFRDIVLMLVFLLFLGIAGLSTALISDSIYDKFKTTEGMNSTAAKQAYDASDDINQSWDFIGLVILIGFALSMIVIGWFIDVHSLFMPIFILAIIVGVPLVIAISYIWEQVSTQGVFVAISSSTFPIMNHIMSNLLIYYVVVAAIAMVATYAKTQIR